MKFFIETYGCQMNVSDSEMITELLIENGFCEAESIDDADILLFNTCSIRKNAEERVLGRINNEMFRKKNKSLKKIGVIGCMAQRLGNSLNELNRNIDFVVGVDQYKNIPDIINKSFDNKFIFYGNLNTKEIYKSMYPKRKGEYNAFVTIMRGCNNFCSYCIVPYTRGRERSRSVDDILFEVESAGNNGFKDITLLGQNVNSYNYNGVLFPELLDKVSNINSIERIRFVTSHPKDISDKLIMTITENKKICEHAHIAMQSGNNEILKAMNRGYTIEHFENIVNKLRTVIPDFAVTTDIIAGFPGETEEQFMDTYNAMKRIEFDYAFTFKYSPREGTRAAKFTNQIEEGIRLKRLQKLIELQEKITLKKYREQIGKIKEVYVEKVSKKSKKELAGKSRDFKITIFEGDEKLIGSFVKVKITEALGWTLKGDMISE